jgi:hypothetical protein
VCVVLHILLSRFTKGLFILWLLLLLVQLLLLKLLLLLLPVQLL